MPTGETVNRFFIYESKTGSSLRPDEPRTIYLIISISASGPIFSSRMIMMMKTWFLFANFLPYFDVFVKKLDLLIDLASLNFYLPIKKSYYTNPVFNGLSLAKFRNPFRKLAIVRILFCV